MRSLEIVLLGLGAAIGYGIVHDQITARVCVEYFTIGHPRIIDSESPTLLGLAWGVVATWWVGLPLGAMLAVAARAGARPPLDARDLWTSVMALVVVMGICAAVAGFVGYEFTRKGRNAFPEDWAGAIPPEKQATFIGDLWAHTASYDVGIIGGAVVCVITWWRRSRLASRAA